MVRAMSGRAVGPGRKGLASFAPLVIAVAVAGWVRWEWVPAHHAMYLDEPWYAEAACNLSRRGALELCRETWSGTVCEPYAKAVGWPLLLSVGTSLGGCDASVGIAANRLLGTATVALLGVTAMAAGATTGQAAFAAALLAIHPLHAAWSATGETNVAAAFALLGGLCGALCVRRRHGVAAALLAVSGLGVATAIRPESTLPALAIAAGLVAATEVPLSRRAAVAAAIAVVTSLAALTALPLWAMNAEISSGGFLSLANVAPALAAVAHSDGWRIHAAVAALGAAGLLAIRRRGPGATALILSSATLAAAAIALAYDRFAERMLLTATVALLPAAAQAFAWLAGSAPDPPWRRRLRPLAEVAALALVLLFWRAPLERAAQPPETQILEQRVVQRVAAQPLPDARLVVAAQPTVLGAAGMVGVMSLEEALRDEARLAAEIARGRPVYLLSDMFCEPGYAGGDAAELCARLRERFDASAVVTEGLNARYYTLLLLSSPR